MNTMAKVPESRRLLCSRIAAFFVCGVLVFAQSAAAAEVDLDAANARTGIRWERMLADREKDTPVVRELSRAYPPPEMVKGEPPDSVNPASAKAIARSFVIENSTLLLGEEGAQLLKQNGIEVKETIANKYPEEYAERGTDYTIVLGQFHKGIPVFESRVLVSMTQFGQIWRVKSDLAVLKDVPAEPAIDAGQALAVARNLFNDAEAEPDAPAQLYVDAPSRLVWRLNFLAPHFRELLIDAVTSEVVLNRKNVRDDPPQEEPPGDPAVPLPSEGGTLPADEIRQFDKGTTEGEEQEKTEEPVDADTGGIVVEAAPLAAGEPAQEQIIEPQVLTAETGKPSPSAGVQTLAEAGDSLPAVTESSLPAAATPADVFIIEKQASFQPPTPAEPASESVVTKEEGAAEPSDPGALTATIWNAWWTNADDQDQDGYPRYARLNWDPDVSGGSDSLTVFEKVYYKWSTMSTWTLYSTLSSHVITGTKISDSRYIPVNGGSHGLWDWKIEVYRVGQASPDYTRDPSNDSDISYNMETASEDAIPATIWNAWWTNETDSDGDGYCSRVRLNWDPDVAIGSGSLTVFEKIYYKKSSSSTWSFLTTMSEHDITGNQSSDSQYIVMTGGGHGTWDWKIEIYRSGESLPDYTCDPSNDSSLNDYKMETLSEDTPSLVAVVRDAWWSNTTDSDGDGYVRSARLNWDPNVSGGSGSLNVFEKIYYKRASVSSWTLSSTTSTHSITGTQTSDSQYVSVTGGSHDKYDWKIEIYRSGQSSADSTRNPSNDGDLNDYKMETSEQDTLNLKVTMWNAWWTSAVDNDSDGYVRSATLEWDADVSGGSGTLNVFAKVYRKTASSSTWSLYTTTSTYSITDTSGSDTHSVSITGAAHNKYDWKIDLYRSGQSSYDESCGPSDDGNLNDYKMETAAEDTPTTATIYNAWWSNTIDNDADGYVQYARLNWDPDVANSSGSLTVFEKIYYKTSSSSTWTLFKTTAAHTITGIETSDQQYTGIQGGSHGLWDWKIEIYRNGQASPDYTRDPGNDSDLNDYRMETPAEDVGVCTIQLTVRDRDTLGLKYAAGEYHANSARHWSKEANAAGFMQDANSPTSTQSFCRARTICSWLDVRDEDSGDVTVQWDSPSFSTSNGNTYSRTIDLTNHNGVNADEAGQAFREMMRAWEHAQINYGYERELTTVYLDSAWGPSCGGSVLYFPHDRAKLDNGAPSSNKSIDDTMNHEYAHALQWAAYGNSWGRPRGCTCANHGGTANDCSHDAFIEGWANYFPVMLYNSINPSDRSYHWSNSTGSRSIESNGDTDTEERDEWSFAGVLYDIFDSRDDGDDRLSLGPDEIWTVLRNDQPGTVEEFFQCFITRYPAHAAALEAIYIDHGMHPNWLTLSTTVLDFGETATSKTFTIRRRGWYGDGVIVQPTWQITNNCPFATSITPNSGDTTTETDTITVTIDRSLLTPGTTVSAITIFPQYYGRMQGVTIRATEKRAAIWDAWWSNSVDNDGDGYVRSARLYWDADVAGGGGSLEVFAKIYWKLPSDTTWNLLHTTTTHTITDTKSSDKRYVSIKGGSHNSYDWKIEVYRKGHASPDDTADPSNDASLNGYRMETESEDTPSGGSTGVIVGMINGRPVNATLNTSYDYTSAFTFGDSMDLEQSDVLQTFLNIDSFIGWHSRGCALPSDGAVNLMGISGGTFTSDTIINFDTGEMMFLHTEVTENEGEPFAHIIVDGMAPELMFFNTLQQVDYTEYWRQLSEGFIEITSDRQYFLDGMPHSYHVSTNVMYGGEMQLPSDQILTVWDVSSKYDPYDFLLHYHQYCTVAPMPMLQVFSKPVSEVQIEGDRPGITGYTAYCAANEIINLAAPPVVTLGGLHYDFVEWTGDGVPDGTDMQILMEKRMTVTANYGLRTHTLTVESTPVADVNIAGTVAGATNYTTTCNDQDTVTLTAPPSAVDSDGTYHVFLHWVVDGATQTEGEKSIQLLMDADRSAEACYRVDSYTLTVQSTPVFDVTISGTRCGRTDYECFCSETSTVSLSAPMQAERDGRAYFFIRWILDETASPPRAADIDIEMNTNHLATAEYSVLGDVTLDCIVDTQDLIFVRNNLNTPLNDDNWLADVNQDEVIDIIDLVIVRNCLGYTCAE